MRKKRILLIAYSFPPAGDAQALRWAYLSRYMVEFGYQIDVVCAQLPEGAGCRFDLPAGVQKVEVFAGPLEHAAMKVKVRIGTDKPNNVAVRTKYSFKFAKKVYRTARSLFGYLLPGDVRSEWFPFAARTVSRLNPETYDIVITSQEPFVDTMLGLWLKSKYPNIVWLADFGDTSFAPYVPPIKRRVDMALEKRAMVASDMVILTNSRAARLVNHKYGIDLSKLLILPQGFEDRSDSQHGSFGGSRKEMILFFSGTFYRGFRDPGHLFDALNRVAFPVKFKVAGRNESFVEGAPGCVEFLGYQDHHKVLKLQQEADILVNIANRQDHQIPGKLFEYLGAAKPILNIVYNEFDLSSSVVLKADAGLNVLNTPHEIERALGWFWRLFKKGRLNKSFRFDRSTIDEYRWYTLAGRLDAAIRGLLHENSR